MQAIGMQLGSIENKELTNTIKATGMLTVPNENKAFITPLSGGVVRTLTVRPGSFVTKGQVLATVTNPGLIPLQQQLQQLNAQIQLATIETKRQEDLYKGNAAPLKNYQRAETELKTLKSQRAGIQQQLSLVGGSRQFSAVLPVRTPISGTVSKITVQIGSNVDVTSPIAEVVNNSQLHLDLSVYEKDLPHIQKGQTIHFTLTNNPGKEYDATVFSIGTAFEGDTKSIPIHASVTGNKTGLIDGMGVTATVSLSQQTAPAIPNDAIINYQGKDYIFIVDEPKKDADKKEVYFKMIPVAKGVTDVGYTQITLLVAIPPGAPVVTKGAFFILAKMTNTGDEH
ncbi:efflux RND transporter periplasmic adaptor subunit [Niabella soli]|uniref:efflux RND transporter periplasmic adaptor subunit n=1 Tax=Niabella soli TaxID=446683 RepID=UPI000249988D|nr:efflux RND transporter periplasmic adaptor subunit [Niabella soli]